MAKKARNPTDTTLRNTRAANKRLAALLREVAELRQRVTRLEAVEVLPKAMALEARVAALESRLSWPLG